MSQKNTFFDHTVNELFTFCGIFFSISTFVTLCSGCQCLELNLFVIEILLLTFSPEDDIIALRKDNLWISVFFLFGFQLVRMLRGGAQSK